MTGEQCFVPCCFGNDKEKASSLPTYSFINFASVHRKTILKFITYSCRHTIDIYSLYVDVCSTVCLISKKIISFTHLLSTPPSKLAFKHSGGDSLLCTSATVTLYLLVDDSNDNRPGTEQNTSFGAQEPEPPRPSRPFIAEKKRNFRW